MSAIGKSCAAGAVIVSTAAGLVCSSPAPPSRVLLCNPTAVQRAATDSNLGVAVNVQVDQIGPTGPYPNAKPANYVEGVGLTCDAPPPGFTQVPGKLADGTGVLYDADFITQQHKGGGFLGVIYPYFKK